ncbi:hypothetical protein EON65_16010 [archaeon]|nr:MAG: hypothetical protein EON65_16010 [archaeon]
MRKKTGVHAKQALCSVRLILLVSIALCLASICLWLKVFWSSSPQDQTSKVSQNEKFLTSAAKGSRFTDRTWDFKVIRIKDSREQANLGSSGLNNQLLSSWITSSYFNASSYNGSIFLYWPYHSDSFSLTNYKSLESILTVYSKAKVTLRIVGPEQADYYKVGNIISKQTFQKYIKYGYKLNVVVQHMIINKKMRCGLPGYKFWTESFTAFYTTTHIMHMREVQHAPYYIAFYDYIVMLYLNGGIVTDFNYLHVHPVINTHQSETGMHLRLYCSAPANCFVSTFLLAPARHPVLWCLLLKYDGAEDKALHECLLNDMMNAGAYCVQQAVADCYQHLGLTNPWDSGDLWCMQAASSKQNGHVSGADTFYIDKVNRTCAHYPIDYDVSLWHSTAAFTETLYTQQMVAPISLPLLWLGSRAVEENWQPPRPSSLLHHLISVLDYKVHAHTNMSISKVASQLLVDYDPSRLPTCSHYNMSWQYKVRASTIEQKRHLQSSVLEAQQSCALSFVIPGFMKAGSSFFFETLIGHPLLLRALRGAQFKETGCYLSYNKRSSVVGQPALQRMHCFPFVQPNEPLFYADATIYYAHSATAMYGIVDDNPNVKIMFSLRNPIKRAESQFRFDYLAYKEDGYSDINECIALALNPSKGKLMQWKEWALRSVQYYTKHNVLDTNHNPHLRALMKLYRRGLKKDSDFHYFRCGNLVLHSLYFLSVFAWMQITPWQNIRLLFTEFLDPRYMSEQLKQKYLTMPPIIDQKISGVELWHKKKTKTEVKRSFNASLPVRYAAMSRIDRKYLLHQFNGIYR